ncbi:putative bifunctional diguanylate cyclase/phosphodiesterase [Motilibacter rhizosphaerae]|nr:EAL domain-containing protein [Motilibacter rhizosphaerae]
MLGTATIEVVFLSEPPVGARSLALRVFVGTALVFHTLAGAWLLATAGHAREWWTRIALLEADVLLLAVPYVLAAVTVPAILVMLLARLPLIVTVLPRRQMLVALATVVLAPSVAEVPRSVGDLPWGLDAEWSFLVAVAVVAGSTHLVVRELATAQAEAQEHEEAARRSETQARAETARAQRLALEASELAEQARALAARREYDALHDPLTGLPNRTLYRDRLAAAVAHASRTGGDVAVLLLDLDRFKLVNDSRGHAAGDVLLRSLGERLAGRLRGSDTLARLGGDEFAVVLQDVDDPVDAEGVAAQLLDALREPFDLRDPESGAATALYITASCGIAFGLGRRDDLGAVLREADTAMYQAKARGRGLVEVFDASLRHVAQRRLDLENQLRHDLETGSGALCAWFQPVVEPRTGRIVALEALARWTCAGYGAVPPPEFVHVAEDSGLVHELGRRMLALALENAARWVRLQPELEIAVNVSPVQLQQPGFAEDVLSALARAELDPGRLCLEITESTLLDPEQHHVATLHLLHEAGVKLAVDDFGSGYSSLAQLRSFPLDKLKADRSFVDDLPILQAVSDLAQALGVVPLAEGVETVEQARFVAALGYQEAQGYLWSRPRPPGDISHLLQGAVIPVPLELDGVEGPVG